MKRELWASATAPMLALIGCIGHYLIPAGLVNAGILVSAYPLVAIFSPIGAFLSVMSLTEKPTGRTKVQAWTLLCLNALCLLAVIAGWIWCVLLFRQAFSDFD